MADVSDGKGEDQCGSKETLGEGKRDRCRCHAKFQNGEEESAEDECGRKGEDCCGATVAVGEVEKGGLVGLGERLRTCWFKSPSHVNSSVKRKIALG
ncbi:MAG: hypothetical protein ACJ71Q_11070 [Terriglobales bacterium]